MNIFTYIARITKRIVFGKLNAGSIFYYRNRQRLIFAKNKQQSFIGIMPGVKMPMVIDPNMYFASYYARGVFEADTLYFIQDNLKLGGTVIDIGANIGYFSLFFSKIVGNEGQVIAIEPGDYAFNILHENKKLNKLDNLQLHQIGLAEEDTVMELNEGQPGMEVYSSLGKIVHNSADPTKFLKKKISVFNGSRWLMNEGIKKVDLMKIDVEGAEYTILRGLDYLFETKSIHILLIEITFEMSSEFGYHPNDIIQFIQEYGYHWFYLGRAGKLFPLKKTGIVSSGMYVAML